MIQAKCIEKIRDKNNIITHYRLKDNEGTERVVTSQQLKQAINNGLIDIINLKLTRDNKLMDRNISDTVKGYSKLQNISTIDVKTHAKAEMLGLAPRMVNGCVVGDSGMHTTIFSDQTTKFAGDINSESDAIFKGNQALTSPFRMRIGFNKITILNPWIMSSLHIGDKDTSTTVFIESSETIIQHELTDIKTVDEIFKIIKSQLGHYYMKINKYIMIEPSIAQNIGYEEIYSRAVSILKRQKPSSKPARRLYDLYVYIKFINCMYLSTDCTDKRYIQLACNYISEIEQLRKIVDRMHSFSDREHLEGIDYLNRAAIPFAYETLGI